MRLLFVVQRYGREVAGGAELHCREFATRLAARGHDVEVLTSCAVSYMDWANWYPAGSEELDGVTVHRLAVASPRSDRFFAPLNSRVVWGTKPVPLHLQEHWIRSSGVVSMRTEPPSSCTSALERVRLSRESLEVQTGQSQPIIGTPCEVPVPSRMTRMRPTAPV